jgi:hypothetical protein
MTAADARSATCKKLVYKRNARCVSVTYDDDKVPKYILHQKLSQNIDTTDSQYPISEQSIQLGGALSA